MNILDTDFVQMASSLASLSRYFGTPFDCGATTVFFNYLITPLCANAEASAQALGKWDHMKRYCLALDLKDDTSLIKEYEEHHRKVWPEILKSIKDAGIQQMEIYRINNRLFMIMETNDDFTFERKSKMDEANMKVQEWEQLMWNYQQAIPGSRQGEKWRLTERIFALNP
jgi:L-rhamnose mutarotase